MRLEALHSAADIDVAEIRRGLEGYEVDAVFFRRDQGFIGEPVRLEMQRDEGVEQLPGGVGAK